MNNNYMLKYIEKNYNFLKKMADKMVGSYNGSELMNELYIYFYDVKSIPDSVIINNKLSFYFYKAMIRYSKSKYSVFNRYTTDKKVYLEYFKQIEVDNEINNKTNLKYTEILSKLDDIYSKKEISWYEYKLFKLFYFSEYEIDIKNISKEDVNNIRKISLRKLEKEIDINFVSISNSLRKTMIKLKESID